MVDIDEEELQDKQILQENISIRQLINQELFKDGKLPEGDEERKLLIANLTGLEKIALTRTRVRGDKANAKTAADAQNIIAQALAANRSKKPLPAGSVRQTLPNEVPRPILVPGELDTESPYLDPAEILRD